MGRGEEILPIFETPLYNKMALGKDLIRSNMTQEFSKFILNLNNSTLVILNLKNPILKKFINI